MHYRLNFLLLFILLLAACQHRTASQPARPTVKSVEIERYLGKWYEIARFPHRFEKNLVGVTATYTKRSDGKIEVINSGFEKTLDGTPKEARGVATIPDTTDASRLKVSFFLFFHADYCILELDTVKYQYALVGSTSDKYLWILSRSPLMTEETYNMLVEKARALGYDVEKLIRVEQKPLAEYEEGKTL
jgi:apolipoprotein D and lipocalin family protein